MKRDSGFTVVELAVVMVIIGLLLGGLMMGLTAQIEQKHYSDTQKGLADVKEVLIGYAIKNKHLPCPDKTAGGGAGTANDGQEDYVAATGICVNQEGNIPWVTLGVSDADAWGHRFHYRVTTAYSNRAPAATFTLATNGTMQICQTAPAGVCTTPLTSADVPAVVLSFGPNGKGAITTSGTLIAAPGSLPTPPATNADEYENTNGNDIFVSRPRSAVGGTWGEFDDQVDWIPLNLLNNRMVSGGALP